MLDITLINSYVWYGPQCFYVSTRDRDSSAILWSRRFAETTVWEFDFDKNERGSQVSTYADLEGSIFTHLQVCQFLHKTGSPYPVEAGNE